MRLCYIGWADHVHLIRWVDYFAMLGHNVLVLTPSENPNKIANVRVIRLFTRKSRRCFSDLEYTFWTHLFRSQLIHAHWAGFGSSAFIASRNRIPYGITVWGSDIYRLNKFPVYEQQKIIHSLKNATFITCDSNDLKKRLIDLGITSEIIYVIQWGVDTKIFRPDIDIRNIRTKLRIPEKSIIIFSPRQTSPIYNLETIMEAFAKLLLDYPNAILIQKYYKTTPERLTELKNYAQLLGIYDRMRWVGNIPYKNMPLFYCLADIVVSVPSSDGTPMSILEAMACARPIIASNLPSVKEWIKDGENGLLVPPKDADALVKALTFLIKNKEKRCFWGKINRQIVIERASQTLHMKRMEEIYENVIKNWNLKRRRCSELV